MSTLDPHKRLQNDLREAIYRAIRNAIACSAAHAHRGIVLQVLCAMAAEQAAIVAHDAAQGLPGYDAPGKLVLPVRLWRNRNGNPTVAVVENRKAYDPVGPKHGSEDHPFNRHHRKPRSTVRLRWFYRVVLYDGTGNILRSEPGN